RQKGWTAITVTTIALGVGATTAVFSVVSSLLLHPLSYRDPSRVVFVHQEPSEGNKTGIAVTITPGARVVRAWKAHARRFEALEAYTRSRVALRTRDEPVYLDAASVEPTFFAFTGQRPMIGRPFSAADLATGAAVVLLGEQSWRTRFGSDSSVVGRTLWLNDSARTVIGVLPATLQAP